MYLVLGKKNCPYCDKAKALLERNGEEYTYVDISDDRGTVTDFWRKFLVEDLKARTVPQVFKVIGGYDMLLAEQTES